MREVDIQRHILDLNEANGGYGFKLSNAFLSGVPDLLLFVPHYVPVIAEVKYIGIRTNPFDSSIALTALQERRLIRVRDVGEFSVVLVAVKWKGKDHVIGYKPDEKRASSQDIASERSTLRRKGEFNLAPIWRALGIPLPYYDDSARSPLRRNNERDPD